MVKGRHLGHHYVMSLLTGYTEAPVGKDLLPGLHYNPYFPGEDGMFVTDPYIVVCEGGWTSVCVVVVVVPQGVCVFLALLEATLESTGKGRVFVFFLLLVERF